MLVHSEAEMIAYGEKIGKNLQAPAAIELIGDVGAGKTTIVKGIAKGLGILEPVTSPSFTVSKVYQGPYCRLVHYDFYRLSEPGIISDELSESLEDQEAVVVVEWGESVRGILPPRHQVIQIKHISEHEREVTVDEALS